MKNFLKQCHDLSQPYRIDHGKKFHLRDYDPEDTGQLGEGDKAEGLKSLTAGIEALAELQDLLYAQDQWSVLLIFQAMDAAGKDGVIKHVMSGINPQGCQVHSFKQPSTEELDHDYLWRTNVRLPERGCIGIFNRSYYEEVLVVRVHPELLVSQKIPSELITKKIWEQRFSEIRHFERHLHRNGTIVRKFFLHVSKKEQKRRFLDRIEKPEKNWKFAPSDAREREHWDEYQAAYEEAIRETATKEAPWYVVPADNKWYTRAVVAAAVVEALASLPLAYPTVSDAQKRELAAARRSLLGEKKDGK